MKLLKRLLVLAVGISLIVLLAMGMGKNEIPLSQLINKPNSTYHINQVYDLMGDKFEIPENCTLVFGKKGKVINGELVGNMTKIRCTKNCIGARIIGSWVTEEIKDEWYDVAILSDLDILESISNMQSDKIHQVITMNKPVYLFKIEKVGGSGIVLSSNTELRLNSTLKLITNNLSTYHIIYINKKKNVLVSGGQIEGDALEHSDYFEKNSEWGMGIEINAGKDITIENMTIRHCWGDAIYVGGGKETAIGIYDNACKNVVVRNVVADDNRRLGLGVIHVEGLNVVNCKFINTGKSKSTPPSAGIDIEPNVKKGRNQSCKNIVFSNCELSGCAGNAFGSWNSVSDGNVSNIEAVTFDSCVISGETGICLNEVTFRNCTLEDIRMLVYSSSVNVSLIDCNLKPKVFRYESSPQVKDASGKLYLKIVGCSIDFSDFTIPYGDINPKDFAELKIDSCRIRMPLNQRQGALRMKTKMTHHMSNTTIEYAER